MLQNFKCLCGIKISFKSVFKDAAEIYLHKKLFSHLELLLLKTSGCGSIPFLVKADL